MTTLTPRIPSAPSSANTRRVATTGEVGGSPASLGGDTWGNTWHGAWGRTWLSVTPAVAATPASPAPDNTARISGAITANNTKRVSLA